MVNQLKINLACGNNKIEDFYGIDLIKTDAADISMDLEQYPWDIESECAEELMCVHYVEHVTDLIKFMDEAYRILKPEGKFKVIAPYYTSIRCWQDPTHKRAISEATFLYFNKTWRIANKLEHYGIKCDFDYQYGYDIQNDWANREENARNFAISHYWNVINDIHVTLVKRKPE